MIKELKSKKVSMLDTFISFYCMFLIFIKRLLFLINIYINNLLKFIKFNNLFISIHQLINTINFFMHFYCKTILMHLQMYVLISHLSNDGSLIYSSIHILGSKTPLFSNQINISLIHLYPFCEFLSICLLMGLRI